MVKLSTLYNEIRIISSKPNLEKIWELYIDLIIDNNYKDKTIKLIRKIGYNDGSFYTFLNNNPDKWLQFYIGMIKIKNEL